MAGPTRAARDHLRQIAQVDVRRVDGTARDPARVARLASSLGRTVATEVRNTTLAADAGGVEGPLSQHTVADYLDALGRLMVIEDQPAWAPHVRSKAVLRGAPKRHFVCPSLAVAATSVGSAQLIGDLEWFGQVFESLVVRDLRVLSQPLDGRVLHYRDSYGLEVDAIVSLPDGRWGAFEVKLGTGQIDDAAQRLNRFASTVDTSKAGPPACLGVICGVAG